MDAQDVQTLIAVVAAAIAAASWWAVKQQVDVMRDQTQLQREIAHEASQPYVYADLQPDPDQGFLLQLVVGNSGPTTATHVHVTFEPPLRFGKGFEDIDTVQARLATGIESLSPGRSLVWLLGSGPDLLSHDKLAHRVTIRAQGPHGAIPTVSYVIDLADLLESRDSPRGTLHYLTKAVEGVGKELKSTHEESKRARLLADREARNSE
jgi:hypothetical protein